MELLISRQTPAFPSLSLLPLEARLADSLRTLLRHEGVSEDAEISLLLCDDPFIQALNAQYRGQDKPTDVLSFGQDASAAPPRPPIMGGAGKDDFGDGTEGEPPTPPTIGGRGEAPASILGDIVISLPTAARQAERAGWPLENELVLLAVHGGLHLLGDDDETADGAARMQRKTAAVLGAVGISPPVEGSHPFFVEYP